ncbi:MAG TPA: SGNH/GDSL hydrolase family protein [Vicinamibacterales bacterium]|nr:SGNH/GDSL hydrolase family protein [Vicinamibacterales bacterium]
MTLPPAVRPWLYRLGAMALSASVAFAILEIGTRLFVADSTFRVLSDVFERHPDAEIGYTYRRTFVSSAFGAGLRTNSLGFRGSDWTRERPANTVRIALIGDSHAFGFGVEFDQTWGELLRGRLAARLRRNVEVMNFGVNGYNSRQEAAVLTALALPLAPDLVVIQVSSNDNDAALKVDAEGFLHTGVKGKPDDIDIWQDRHQQAYSWFQRRMLSTSRFLTWVRILRLRWQMRQAATTMEAAVNAGLTSLKGDTTSGPIDESLRASVYEPLTAMVRNARAKGAAVVLVTFAAPAPWRQTLKALAASENVRSLDLIAALNADTWKGLLERWSLGWDAHMGPAAHAVWAARIDELLSAPELTAALLHSGVR